MAAAGNTNDEIASPRNVSHRAVEFRLQNIRQKLNMLTTYQAIGIAMKEIGMIEPLFEAADLSGPHHGYDLS